MRDLRYIHHMRLERLSPKAAVSRKPMAERTVSTTKLRVAAPDDQAVAQAER